MTSSSNWYTYIVQCADQSLYTGISTDLIRRIEEHNSSPNGAKYTKARRPVRLVYFEKSESRSEASKREHALKQLTTTAKRQFVTNAYQHCQQLLHDIYPDSPILYALKELKWDLVPGKVWLSPHFSHVSHGLPNNFSTVVDTYVYEDTKSTCTISHIFTEFALQYGWHCDG